MDKAHNSDNVTMECDICHEYFSKENMGRHKEVHLEHTIPCDMCAKMFPSKRSLNTHKQGTHNKIKVDCDICGANVSSHCQKMVIK